MKRIDLIKAGGYAANANLRTVDVKDPTPTANEVLIDVKASAIQPVDWKMMEMGFMLPETLPASLGCDVAGDVLAGPEEWVGKRVFTYLGANKANSGTNRGAFVDKVNADKDVVFEVPEEMTYAQAASLPVGGLTAFLLLNRLNPSDGDCVLVWGASSSVGFNAVQLAAKRGFKVIAVASAKHKETIMSAGATSFVDYRKDNVEDKVKELVDGAHLNSAVDCIGAADAFSTSAKLVSTLGSSDAAKAVSSVSPLGLPDPPEGVDYRPVDLGTALDKKDSRKVVKEGFLALLSVKPQKIVSIKGPITAETVEKALQKNKDGVSGEKVVIEWTK